MIEVRYTANVECSNCGYSGKAEPLRGHPIREFPCPGCSCICVLSLRVPEPQESAAQTGAWSGCKVCFSAPCKCISELQQSTPAPPQGWVEAAAEKIVNMFMPTNTSLTALNAAKGAVVSAIRKHTPTAEEIAAAVWENWYSNPLLHLLANPVDELTAQIQAVLGRGK